MASIVSNKSTKLWVSWAAKMAVGWFCYQLMMFCPGWLLSTMLGNYSWITNQIIQWAGFYAHDEGFEQFCSYMLGDF